MKIVHLLNLSTLAKADMFAQFARDEWLPGLSHETTRAGVLIEATLLRRRQVSEEDAPDLGRQFVLTIDWDGVPIELPKAAGSGLDERFAAFGAEITQLGVFEPVGSSILHNDVVVT